MINPKVIEEMTEEKKISIIGVLIDSIDELLKKEAISLHEKTSISFNINASIEYTCSVNDDDQLLFNYAKMRDSKMDIAERLAEMYRKSGWIVTVTGDAEDNWNHEPILLFSIINS